jgi:hypothetical protein
MSDAENTGEACLTIQPAPAHDGPTAVLPYPYHVFVADGAVGRQDHWKGNPASLIGFAAKFRRHTVDLLFDKWVVDPDKAVGMYPVFADGLGDFATYPRPVKSVRRGTARRVRVS